MANKKINDFTTEITSPVADDMVEIESLVEGSRKIKATNLVPATPPTSLPPSGNFLKSGGAFSHDGGLDIAVGTAEYFIQGVPYVSPAATVTAAAADATNPRIDAVVLNTSGVAAIITGTPAASPVRPEIDPSTQLELTFITVAALATEPEISVESIYLENTEWTVTPSAGTIDPDDVTGPRSGTKAIKITAGAAGTNFKAVDAAPFDVAAKQQLTFWVDAITWVSQKQIQIRCYLSNVAVGSIVTLRDGVFGFVRTVTGYQLVAIPTSAFGLGATVPDEIRWTIAGGSTALTCFIDDIALQGGLSSVASKGMLNPMTTAGDSIVGGTDGAPTRFALGTALQQRRVNAAGTAEEYFTPGTTKGYLNLTHPHIVQGTNTTFDTNPQGIGYGHARFSGTADQATNYCEYLLQVPENLDTTVALRARLKIILVSTDTAAHRYVLSSVSVADSAAPLSATLANAINIDFAGDASGESLDVETSAWITLTGWAAALTPGQTWRIRLARDGDAATEDASTVASFDLGLVIEYGIA